MQTAARTDAAGLRHFPITQKLLRAALAAFARKPSRLRSAEDGASVGNPRMNCVADDFIDARWQIEADPDQHRKCGNQSAHQSLLNRRLDGSVSGFCAIASSSLAHFCDGTAHARPKSIDNEHQSSLMGFRRRANDCRLDGSAGLQRRWRRYCLVAAGGV